MFGEETTNPHRFNEIIEQFPENIQLEKFLFQDESLLWAEKLPLSYRFRSLGVIMCLLCALVFIILDVVILIKALSPLGLVVASLPLPLIVFPLRYAIHRLQGDQIQVVTNYRVMQCTVRFRSFYIRSLTFHCIAGILVHADTIEFSVKDLVADSMQKKTSELKSMVFRGVTHVSSLETLVQRQLNSSLSEFQYPPNIDTAVRVDTLPSQYKSLLPELGIEPGIPSAVEISPSAPHQLLWISTPSFFESYRTVITNTLLAEVWLIVVFFSPAVIDPSALEGYLWLALLLILVVPVVMILFNYLARVDVLTTKGILLFYTGFKDCAYGPKVYSLDYKTAFPHSCEIGISDGSGTINFENIPPKGLSMLKWPDVLAREELIFRKHSQSYR